MEQRSLHIKSKRSSADCTTTGAKHCLKMQLGKKSINIAELHFKAILFFRIVKSILEHEEMEGLFGSICEEFVSKFKLAKLDMSDFPKFHSSNQETIHFITRGEKVKPF